MQDYITGILENSEVLEAYHGIAFARRLTWRTLVGSKLTVEDPTGMTNDLQLHKRYNFIIAVSDVDRVRAFTSSKIESAKYSGTIRSLKWVPSLDRYLIYNEEITKKPMSIVGTVSGNVLLSRLLLGGVEVGNAVTWGRDQFEIVAVYNN
jgi:hypothetical protein